MLDNIYLHYYESIVWLYTSIDSLFGGYLTRRVPNNPHHMQPLTALSLISHQQALLEHSLTFYLTTYF